MYAIYRTLNFDKEITKQLSLKEQKEVEEFEKKHLKENPYVGDPLGYRFFREKRVGVKRIYYLIYDDLQAVLMVGVSDKKMQQETIAEIRNHLDYYHEVIKEAIKLHGEFDHV